MHDMNTFDITKLSYLERTIFDMASRGIPYKQIAAFVNLRVESVYAARKRIQKKLGDDSIKTHRSWNRNTQEIIDTVANLRKEGKTAPQIAEIIGRSLQSVLFIFRKLKRDSGK